MWLALLLAAFDDAANQASRMEVHEPVSKARKKRAMQVLVSQKKDA